MQPLPLSISSKKLVEELTTARKPAVGGQVFHVASLGAGFYFAYEQLRNVAEYREHHLLLRSAIERFLVRDVHFNNISPVAAELVTELTQAGYLKNDSIPLSEIDHIDRLIRQYGIIHQAMTSQHGIDNGTAIKWLFQYASVQIENLLTPDPNLAVFIQFAYEHYLTGVDSQAVEKVDASDQNYRIALYCAMQRALFKSNLATTRYYATVASLGELNDQPVEHIIELNQLIDRLFQAPMTNRLARLLTRYGAPIRILREFVLDRGTAADAFKASRSETLSKIKLLCTQQYAITQDQLNKRIGKTILFVLITKTLIGISIEIPYDLAMFAEILWLPLAINIFFPLFYMTSISMGIHAPSRQNTEVVTGYIDRILYEGAGAPVTYKPRRRVKSRSLNVVFTTIYAFGFIGSISLLIWLLHKAGFNLVNGSIFFLFFSAVSFLGFRLRQSARELQLLDERQGLLQTLADFLSAPFVRMGHWLSDKYAKANIVTFMLDLAIEMPLKTSLRVVRQWVGFMRDKQEEL